MSGLDVIEPAMVDGVKPLTVGQLAPFARAIRPAAGAIERMFADGEFTFESLLGLIDEHGESIVSAVAIATQTPVAALNAGHPDQLIELALAVLKVNKDFLMRRLTPAMRAAIANMTPEPMSPGDGQTQSNP